MAKMGAEQYEAMHKALVRQVAEAIHEGRCTSPERHASDEAYQHCANFYEDHATLAVDAIEASGEWRVIWLNPEGITS